MTPNILRVFLVESVRTDQAVTHDQMRQAVAALSLEEFIETIIDTYTEYEGSHERMLRVLLAWYYAAWQAYPSDATIDPE